MTDIPFDSRTARHELPLLFAGQAQKESFVNEALARIDALLHLAVEAVQAAPPDGPSDGQAWIIAPAPSGDWSERAGLIAARQGGQWLYFVPREGMRAFDRGSLRELVFRNGWIAAERPDEAIGGTTVDSEARQAIARVITELQRVGIFSSN
ncbi:uncharacterized protein DUF2793 [Novosphingobium kunmingense]|uniref:Uncharacterized protein DUF2793 n=1 Tax=Novosphingobium kunmingense TaxID=1211806 RepID=A0A2N0H5L4_9SPHN|nr:DUF2793 domain-containing protein [Novosphingobium kunmingense]PKB14229.1 uncharacterized protein DUF2793 [Novosphingobium kunmingense]